MLKKIRCFAVLVAPMVVAFWVASNLTRIPAILRGVVNKLKGGS